jgi:hypothetical protein
MKTIETKGAYELAEYGVFFKNGDVVRDRYGVKHVVLEHNGCEVLTYSGNTIHPRNLIKAA